MGEASARNTDCSTTRSNRVVALAFLKHLARRFHSEDHGAVAVLMGIMIATLLLFSAFAIDYSRFVNESMQDSEALDASLIAGATEFRKTQDKAAAIDRAKRVYLANRPDGSKADIESLVPDAATSQVSGNTNFNWKTTLLGAFGYKDVQMRSAAEVKYGRLSEVVLVIDNSAFVGADLENFRAAGLNLKTELMGYGESAGVKMGVVPFAGSVNVGPQYRYADWMDQHAAVGFHRENYRTYLGAGAWLDPAEETATRFDLFDRLGETWAGCVEARSGAYKGNDLPPDTNIPGSLFVPMFAPDEPDAGRNPKAPEPGQSYYNNYLEDYPQSDCPKEACVKQTGRGTCLEYAQPAFTPEEWQEVSCKYAPGRLVSKNAISIGGRGLPVADFVTGPNFNCTSIPLQPLTTDSNAVANTLNAMRASGGSNIAEGILWGYRVLSPQQPFTGGGDFDDESYQKFMIVLARGANWIEAFRDDLNNSIYTPWGYATLGDKGNEHAPSLKARLNPESHTRQALTNAMDELSRDACRTAAEKGVQVFTIGYQVSDPQMRSMLKYCAVHPEMYFEAETLDGLKDRLSTIASRITRLHLTH